MESLHEKLINIQQKLKVPKDQSNDFGGFKYRNIEDIEDKVKPLLAEYKLTLRFEDMPVEVGGRVYIKAVAHLSDGKDICTNTAYAREALSPKAKTDDAQLTGATSSYARKYAASGLFLIDNTKDADSQDNSVVKKEKMVTNDQKVQIKTLLALEGIATQDMPGALESDYGVAVGSVMTYAHAEQIIKDLQKGNHGSRS